MPGNDKGFGQRGTEASLPGHDGRLVDAQQEFELLAVEVVVVGEAVAEQREGLGGGSPSGGDLSPSARDRVNGGELLEQAHRIVCAEHGHGATQPDAGSRSGGGGQDSGRRRGGHLLGVVLADSEVLQPHLIGQHDRLLLFFATMRSTRNPHTNIRLVS